MRWSQRIRTNTTRQSALWRCTLGVPVVGGFGAWDGGDSSDADGVPQAVETVCELSFMCPQDGVRSDIHPNRKGYKVFAKVLFTLLKDTGIV